MSRRAQDAASKLHENLCVPPNAASARARRESHRFVIVVYAEGQKGGAWPGHALLVPATGGSASDEPARTSFESLDHLPDVLRGLMEEARNPTAPPLSVSRR